MSEKEALNPTIAIDATSALAQGGGIGRFTRGLIQGLARVDQESSYLLGYAKDARGRASTCRRIFAGARWA